jgi:hypothetical protein
MPLCVPNSGSHLLSHRPFKEWCRICVRHLGRRLFYLITRGVPHLFAMLPRNSAYALPNTADQPLAFPCNTLAITVHNSHGMCNSKTLSRTQCVHVQHVAGLQHRRERQGEESVDGCQDSQLARADPFSGTVAVWLACY